MGQKYLMDTNAVIDYLGNNIPTQGSVFLDNLPIIISVVTRIEVLGWYGVTSQQLEQLNSFIITAQIFSIEEKIILKTIDLRQQHKIKLPDAIIAATALAYDFTLITSNISDFRNIKDLRLINPHEIQ